MVAPWLAAHQGEAQRAAPVPTTPEATVQGNDRYCRLLADHAEAGAVASGCAASSERRDEAFGRCTYHLSATWTHVHAEDAAALSRCRTDLDRALAHGHAVRVPPSCQVDRVFHDLRGAPRPFSTLGRPRGADCRAENGDEGFDADFRCATDLVCTRGVCASRTPHDEPSPSLCDVLLDLPLAIP